MARITRNISTSPREILEAIHDAASAEKKTTIDASPTGMTISGKKPLVGKYEITVGTAGLWIFPVGSNPSGGTFCLPPLIRLNACSVGVFVCQPSGVKKGQIGAYGEP